MRLVEILGLEFGSWEPDRAYSALMIVTSSEKTASHVSAKPQKSSNSTR